MKNDNTTPYKCLYLTFTLMLIFIIFLSLFFKKYNEVESYKDMYKGMYQIEQAKSLKLKQQLKKADEWINILEK